eukprot:maker-scaffold281_size224178-snap-gene-1.27 protein:Tk10998 transcript:maker-scaffold281_size224178-snap-gene-1.27-mRNA-1 annotation:"hypothetical protein LOTGIDRAFT_173604"
MANGAIDARIFSLIHQMTIASGLGLNSSVGISISNPAHQSNPSTQPRTSMGFILPLALLSSIEMALNASPYHLGGRDSSSLEQFQRSNYRGLDKMDPGLVQEHVFKSIYNLENPSELGRSPMYTMVQTPHERRIFSTPLYREPSSGRATSRHYVNKRIPKGGPQKRDIERPFYLALHDDMSGWPFAISEEVLANVEEFLLVQVGISLHFPEILSDEVIRRCTGLDHVLVVLNLLLDDGSQFEIGGPSIVEAAEIGKVLEDGEELLQEASTSEEASQNGHKFQNLGIVVLKPNLS